MCNIFTTVSVIFLVNASLGSRSIIIILDVLCRTSRLMSNMWLLTDMFEMSCSVLSPPLTPTSGSAAKLSKNLFTSSVNLKEYFKTLASSRLPYSRTIGATHLYTVHKGSRYLVWNISTGCQLQKSSGYILAAHKVKILKKICKRLVNILMLFAKY
jgi:hypothetical protein